MSSGACCRSPSMAMMTSPLASWNPADSAAVWPKLRRSRITFRWRVGLHQVGQQLEAAVVGRVVDEENFVGRCSGSSTAVRRSYSGRMDGSSLWIGITIDSIAMGNS